MEATSGTGTSIIDALRLFSKGLLDHLCVMVTAHHPNSFLVYSYGLVLVIQMTDS